MIPGAHLRDLSSCDIRPHFPLRFFKGLETLDHDTVVHLFGLLERRYWFVQLIVEGSGESGR